MAKPAKSADSLFDDLPAASKPQSTKGPARSRGEPLKKASCTRRMEEAAENSPPAVASTGTSKAVAARGNPFRSRSRTG